jgi:hypothetical protein
MLRADVDLSFLREMENSEWFKRDNTGRFVLVDGAPGEAKRLYEKYLKFLLENTNAGRIGSFR